MLGARPRLVRSGAPLVAAPAKTENFPPRVSPNTQTLPPDRRPPFPRAQDTVTSMIIPMGFAAAGLTLLVKGIDDLSWGKNRKEGF